MKRIKSVVAALAACVFMVSFAVVNAERPQDSKAERRIQVRSVTSRLPVAFKLATATRVDERTVLSYALTNRADDRITSAQVVTFVTNAAGAIVGGEGWMLDVDLAKGSTETYSAILKNRVEPGGQVILSVLKASGSVGGFELTNQELLSLIRSQVVGAEVSRPSFTKASYASTLAVEATYCEGSLALNQSL